MGWDTICALKHWIYAWYCIGGLVLLVASKWNSNWVVWLNLSTHWELSQLLNRDLMLFNKFPSFSSKLKFYGTSGEIWACERSQPCVYRSNNIMKRCSFGSHNQHKLSTKLMIIGLRMGKNVCKYLCLFLWVFGCLQICKRLENVMLYELARFQPQIAIKLFWNFRFTHMLLKSMFAWCSTHILATAVDSELCCETKRFCSLFLFLLSLTCYNCYFRVSVSGIELESVNKYEHFSQFKWFVP